MSSYRIVGERLVDGERVSEEGVGLVVLPPDQWREADEEGEHPHAGDQQFGAARIHDRRVRNGPRHRHVAVQRDGAQVQDGRRAHPHVHRQPDGAPRIAE